MKYFFISFFFVFILSSCDSVRDNLSEASVLINKSPESALKLLEELKDDYDDMIDKEKALYGLLLSQTLNKNDQSLLTNTHLLDFSIKYYQKKNDKKQLAHCWFYKSRACQESRNYTAATELLLETLHFEKHINDFSLYGKIYFDLGAISHFQKEPEDAIRYYEMAIHNFEKVGEKNNIAITCSSIAKSYQSLKKYTDALHFAFESEKNAVDSIIIGDALDEIGSCYTQLQKYDSAYFYLKKSLQYPHNESSFSLRCLNLADFFFDSHQYDSAAYYAKFGLNQIKNLNNTRASYRILANVAYMQNKQDELKIYLDKYHEYTDSVNLLRSEPKIGTIKYLSSVNKTSKDVQKNKNVLLIVLFCIICLSAITIGLIVRKFQKKKLHIINQKRESENNYRSLYKELIEKLRQEKIIYNANSKKNTYSERELKIKDKEFYNKFLFINDKELFFKKMNTYLNNLPDKLKHNYPDLTYKEIVFCCLITLQLSNSDITQILDQKQVSLYKFKQRLRQKLNLETVRDLMDFLLHLMEKD